MLLQKNVSVFGHGQDTLCYEVLPPARRGWNGVLPMLLLSHTSRLLRPTNTLLLMPTQAHPGPSHHAHSSQNRTKFFPNIYEILTILAFLLLTNAYHFGKIFRILGRFWPIFPTPPPLYLPTIFPKFFAFCYNISFKCQDLTAYKPRPIIDLH